MTDAATPSFDRDEWERHWREALGSAEGAPNPYLDRETRDLAPGRALDAGCGTGAEAVRLAALGWQVSAVDIAESALTLAARRAAGLALPGSVSWIEADLTVWEPDAPFDLVTTNYAHASIPQLDLYRRLAGWVAPGGTLLIVGHLHDGDGHGGAHGHGDRPPAEAAVSLADVIGVLDRATWRMETAEQHVRTAAEAGDQILRRLDVVVRARRRPVCHHACG